MKNKQFGFCVFCFLILMIMYPVSTLLCQQDAILDVEATRFQAQMEKDLATLTKGLHEELYYLHSNGFSENKQGFIKSVESGSITYEEMTSREHRFQRFGKTVILGGILRVKGLYKGSEFDIDLYYTSVYRKKRNRWQLLSWQSTRKPDE